eukprot:TRINITY_DN29617_c0_g1_i1.p1 TRINITY_DN29617_c0_g1~~TRINITY_DN29617_c0_g1_i1.p1  ORF type:complete len:166 (-),score=11.06 TRINITY_DN29617_c0_g1_i1:88-585(-)
MHKVKPEHFPEVVQRRIFPYKPSRPPSPALSRISTPALSRTARQHQSRDRQPYILNAHGIEYIDQPGPALMSRSSSMPSLGGAPSSSRRDPAMRGLDLKISKHNYSDRHEFGHHSVTNNMNPFLTHSRIPTWSTSNTDYGTHYRHPSQTYVRPQKNRMPVFHVQI